MKNNITKAMVLAAGEGIRLRPLTLSVPKTMLPVGGIPLIGHIIRWLKSYGISEVGINLFYLGNMIMDYLGDGSRFGLKIIYSQEENLLGTAGGVKRLESFFAKERFILVYGDVLTDFNITKMIACHLKNRGIATIALFAASNAQEVGIVEIDQQKRILNFVEKPPKGTEKSNLANGAVYILEPEIFDYIPASACVDFAFHVFPLLLERGIPLYGYKLKSKDYLIDIGSLVKYQEANGDYLDHRVKL